MQYDVRAWLRNIVAYERFVLGVKQSCVIRERMACGFRLLGLLSFLKHTLNAQAPASQKVFFGLLAFFGYQANLLSSHLLTREVMSHGVLCRSDVSTASYSNDYPGFDLSSWLAQQVYSMSRLILGANNFSPEFTSQTSPSSYQILRQHLMQRILTMQDAVQARRRLGLFTVRTSRINNQRVLLRLSDSNPVTVDEQTSEDRISPS